MPIIVRIGFPKLKRRAMTNTTDIKSKALGYFRAADYSKAFSELWKLERGEFLSYAQSERKEKNPLHTKTNWLIDQKSSGFFWNEFSLKEEVFPVLFLTGDTEHLLHLYFSRSRQFSEELIKRLASACPGELVKAVRLNSIFLKPDRVDFLCSLSLLPDLSIHQESWKKIQSEELEIWLKVESAFSDIVGKDLETLLADTVIWLELSRFKNNNRARVHQLALVYSFFIEYVCKSQRQDWRLSDTGLNGDTFFMLFMQRMKKAMESGDNFHDSPVSKTLGWISVLLDFHHKIVDPYCFNLNYQPTKEGDFIYLQTTPEEHYNWLVDGVRYEFIQLGYNQEAALFVEEAEKQGLMVIPKGRSSGDEDINRLMAGMKYASLFILEEMAISTIRSGNVDVSTEDILTPLITFSFNRLFRYEHALMKFEQQSKNWYEAFMRIFAEGIKTDIAKEPYVFIGKEEFIDLNNKAVPQLTPETPNHVMKIFSYRKESLKKINRFDLEYEVWQKPYLDLGDNIFSPLIFFGTNVWFYAFVQEALLQRKGTNSYKNETTQMENHLGDKIREKGWGVKVVSDEEASSVKGDVDIIVEDGDSLLFIQLKRTYLRLNSKDCYYESILIDKKAANQLNEAEKYLAKKNPIYNIQKAPVKWIVSTSCEGILQGIDGCSKVNYFELINALKNPEIKSLRELIMDVEGEMNLKKVNNSLMEGELPEELKEIVLSIGLPIPLLESQSHRILLSDKNKEKTYAYFQDYNRALELDGNGKKAEAIGLFWRCIQINNSDGDAWAAMANSLMDIGCLTEGYIAFEHAIRLLPGNPMLMRNYGLALMEGHQYFKGLKLLQDLCVKYPLMGDTRKEFDMNYENCLKHGLLLIEEVSFLNRRKTEYEARHS